jgi:hypothetical protein
MTIRQVNGEARMLDGRLSKYKEQLMALKIEFDKV